MDNRTLHQALRAASINPLHIRSFIKLATGCGFLTTISDGTATDASTPTSHQVDPVTSSALLFPSPKAVGGVAALLANGHLCVFPHTHSSSGPEESARCALVEPLCVIILLFPDCFLEHETSPTGGDSDTTETLEDLLAGMPSQSLDTSLDCMALPPSAAICASSGQFSASHLGLRSNGQAYSEETFHELCSQRDSLALSVIADIDEQVKRGSARLLTLQHIKAAGAAPSKKYSAPTSRAATAENTVPTQSSVGAIEVHDILTSSHLGEGTIVGVQQRLSRLHLWKLLLVSCLSANAMAVSRQLQHSGNFASPTASVLNVLDKIGNGEWSRLPLRDWGWTTLVAAERQYDDIVQGLNNQFQSSALITSNRMSSVNPYNMSIPGSLKAFPFPSPISCMPATLAHITTDMSHLRLLGSAVPALLFNEADATFSALLETGTQKKLSSQQVAQVGLFVSESFCDKGSTRMPFHLVARQRITTSFLERADNASLLAERNRDIFVLLFKALSKTMLPQGAAAAQASECRDKMKRVLVTMGVAEPSCHIVKVLHDDKLIDDSDLSSFVARAVEEVTNAQHSYAAGNTPSPPVVFQESQQRVQRSVTLLSLLLQNMFLANKRVVLVEPVDQVLIAFCLEHSNIRACSELYRTLMTLRGSKR
jgi:hypothetical protein